MSSQCTQFSQPFFANLARPHLYILNDYVSLGVVSSGYYADFTVTIGRFTDWSTGGEFLTVYIEVEIAAICDDSKKVRLTGMEILSYSRRYIGALFSVGIDIVATDGEMVVSSAADVEEVILL